MPSVFSLNLDGYDTKHGKWDDRMKQVQLAVRHTDADVIVLQGVNFDKRISSRNQAEQLGELLAKDYPFCHFEPVHQTGGVAESLAMLAKVTPADIFVHRLSQRPAVPDHPRLLMHTYFEFVDGQVFNIFNVSLSPVYEQAFDNIRDLVMYTNTFEAPGLIIGDFNRPHDSPLAANLREGGWSDAYSTLFPNDDGFTYEAPNPTIRRTQAWSKGLEIKKAKVIMSEAAEVRMSGHRGLSIEF